MRKVRRATKLFSLCTKMSPNGSRLDDEPQSPGAGPSKFEDDDSELRECPLELADVGQSCDGAMITSSWRSPSR